MSRDHPGVHKKVRKPRKDHHRTVSAAANAFPVPATADVVHVPSVAPIISQWAPFAQYQPPAGPAYYVNPGSHSFAAPYHNVSHQPFYREAFRGVLPSVSQLTAWLAPKSTNMVTNGGQNEPRDLLPPANEPFPGESFYQPPPGHPSLDASNTPRQHAHLESSRVSVPPNPNPVFGHVPKVTHSTPSSLPPLADIIGQPLKMSIPEKAPGNVQNGSSETLAIRNLLNPQAECKNVQNADDAFSKLMPAIKNVNTKNFGSILVEVLKQCHDDVPLDAFYNILYNHDPTDDKFHQTPSIARYETNERRLEGLRLCFLVLEALKSLDDSPNPLKTKPLRNRSLPVSFHEILRTFLAIKILFSSIEEVKDPSKVPPSLPRLAVYKVYYSICQRLIYKYPTSSNSIVFQQNIILGQSNLGRIAKLIYPNLISKRLGRRGCSKFHYVGFKWNPATIDPQTLGFIDLEIPQLKEHFENSQGRFSQQKSQVNVAGVKAQPTGKDLCLIPSVSPSVSTKMTAVLPSQKSVLLFPPQSPLHTYGNLSCKYPAYDCAPRVWKEVEGVKPQHSHWAKAMLEKCSQVLNSHGVDVGPLARDFNAGIYDGGLSVTVVQAMKTLNNASSANETYLHLYLFVILLIFPVIIASDREVSCASKNELQTCVSTCIAQIESGAGDMRSADSIGVTNFTRILRKMNHISALTSSTVKAAWAKGVVEEIIHDLKNLGKPAYSSDSAEAASADCGAPADFGAPADSDLSRLEDIVVRAILMSINAYDFHLTDHAIFQKNGIDATIHIARTFSNAVMMSIDVMQPASVSSGGSWLKQVSQDVPYQKFKLSIRLFHKALSYPEVLQLPIPIITYIMLYMQNEMQNESYAGSRDRDPELTEETFKTWWMYCKMFSEYVGTMAEVAALSARIT
ncbi:hypothetical protein JCM33374_g905 [Metschnikowia sp. JCM 33374]|nr:hypothetical protein JCM33374_g905 [Metschnikowia sp. JCM 33374]